MASMVDNLQINAIAKAKISDAKTAKKDAIGSFDFADMLASNKSIETKQAPPKANSGNADQKDQSSKVVLDESTENSSTESSTESSLEQVKIADRDDAIVQIVFNLQNPGAIVTNSPTNVSGENILPVAANQSNINLANLVGTNNQNNNPIMQPALTPAQIDTNSLANESAAQGVVSNNLLTEGAQVFAADNTKAGVPTPIADANANMEAILKSAGLANAKIAASQPGEQNHTSGKNAQLASNIEVQNADSNAPSGNSQSDNSQSFTPNSANNGTNNNAQFAPSATKQNKLEAAAVKLDTIKPADSVAEAANNATQQTQTENTIELQTTQTQTTDATRINIQAMAATISRKHLNGEKSIFVRLDPAELGGVSVELKFGANKKLTAIINVEKIEALKELSNNSANLLQSLRDSGLDVADNAIEFQLDPGYQEQSQSQNWAHENQSKANKNNFTKLMDEPEITPREIASAKSTTPHLEIWKRARVSLEA